MRQTNPTRIYFLSPLWSQSHLERGKRKIISLFCTPSTPCHFQVTMTASALGFLFSTEPQLSFRKCLVTQWQFSTSFLQPCPARYRFANFFAPPLLLTTCRFSLVLSPRKTQLVILNPLDLFSLIPQAAPQFSQLWDAIKNRVGIEFPSILRGPFYA